MEEAGAQKKISAAKKKMEEAANKKSVQPPDGCPDCDQPADTGTFCSGTGAPPGGYLNDIVDTLLLEQARGIALTAGAPRLTFRKALQGDRADAFQQALRREHDTLFGPGQDGEPCLEFVPWDHLPPGCRPSRYVLVAKDKDLPDGGHKAKMRGTFDGSTLKYAGPVAADTADILLVRAHWHACLARGWYRATADISSFYVGTPMQHGEWMEVRLSQLPWDIAHQEHIRRLCQGIAFWSGYGRGYTAFRRPAVLLVSGSSST